MLGCANPALVNSFCAQLICGFNLIAKQGFKLGQFGDFHKRLEVTSRQRIMNAVPVSRHTGNYSQR
jgi:hypothetical protein